MGRGTGCRAAVVGGSNGMGLAVSIQLMQMGYEVEILDVCRPDLLINEYRGKYTYHYCNLYDFESELFEEMSCDRDLKVLFITAGIGRIAEFRYLHISEIEKMLTINTVSSLKLIKIFYDRIRGSEPFYCGIMGSIAGWVSSPLFSVYAASKAAVCRFVESVNIELEAEGTPNRILNVSPGSLKGTCFYGGKNDPAQVSGLVEEIIGRLFQSETLFIPQYEETYAEVIDRYQSDAHRFGLESLQYKRSSGRMDVGERAIIGYLSGTFDLFHIGHLNLLRRAKQECDYLTVGVHASGAWKGKETFIPLKERMEIVAACRYVDKVILAKEEDSDVWEELHYNRLFVGSDYKGSERFKGYENFFKDKDVEIVYFPYTKETSSTKLREKLSDKQ